MDYKMSDRFICSIQIEISQLTLIRLSEWYLTYLVFKEVLREDYYWF